MNATATTENTTAAAATTETPKAVQAFFLEDDRTTILFIESNEKAPALVFGGTIAGERVGAFLQHRKDNGAPFLSFLGNKVEGQDLRPQIATGNIRTIPGGAPRLVVSFPDKAKKELWLTPTKNLSDERLVELGLDLEKQAAKRDAAAKAKAEGTPANAEAPATPAA